ncbi:zinc-binding dehydrogenase [Streptomyces sp. NPDC005134]|uniref:zinc-binding dehydrogenase n=1 Tax=Streptomyces sp. NPDC005098 TaxID=3154560 RepID=UPI0033B8CEA3
MPSTATGPYRRTTFDPADVVLVLGSGGGSLFATQFARAAGATVWATPSSPAKAERLAELGVSEVVDYARLPWWGSGVLARTGGVALVVDSGRSGSLDQAIAAVAPGGEIAHFGLVDQAQMIPDLITVMARTAIVRGTAVGSRAAFGDLAAAIDAHRIRPVIDRVGAFDDADDALDAYRVHAAAGGIGKIVIEIVPPDLRRPLGPLDVGAGEGARRTRAHRWPARSRADARGLPTGPTGFRSPADESGHPRRPE